MVHGVPLLHVVQGFFSQAASDHHISAICILSRHIYTAELLFPTAQRQTYIPIERIFSHLRIAATLLYRDDISVTFEE